MVHGPSQVQIKSKTMAVPPESAIDSTFEFKFKLYSSIHSLNFSESLIAIVFVFTPLIFEAIGKPSIRREWRGCRLGDLQFGPGLTAFAFKSGTCNAFEVAFNRSPRSCQVRVCDSQTSNSRLSTEASPTRLAGSSRAALIRSRLHISRGRAVAFIRGKSRETGLAEFARAVSRSRGSSLRDGVAPAPSALHDLGRKIHALDSVAHARPNSGTTRVPPTTATQRALRRIDLWQRASRSTSWQDHSTRASIHSGSVHGGARLDLGNQLLTADALTRSVSGACRCGLDVDADKCGPVGSTDGNGNGKESVAWTHQSRGARVGLGRHIDSSDWGGE
ncbi:hypothetical protein B0H11DRAFT_1899546 [Mycena galericulata]|nr:hypothetical protein B0H11DRAFT_1899546 [Mycena galericulata]